MDEFVKTKLNEWQLDTLLDTFKEQEVDEESFLLLDDAAMQHLIPKIGQRLKFQKHHKELLQAACSTKDQCLSEKNVETVASTTLLTVVLHPEFAIRQMLGGSLEGRSILSTLDEKQSITSKERKLLVRLLVSHLIEKHGEMPPSDTKIALAMALIYEFPCLKDDTGSSYGAWYTPGRKHRPATGFLEERLRNVRKRMRSLIRPRQQEPQEDHAVLTPDSLSSPQNIREMVAWLKANKYPVSEVEAKMKETSIHRSKWIRCNGSKTISEILREFPRLTDNPGMISQDFQQLHPEAAGQMFEKWPAIADKILKYAQREGKINVVPDDVTPGERALKALPNLLPPSLFKRGGKIVRPTTAESQRAFVNMQPVGTNIVEYLTNVDNTFPHVLSLGHERVSQTFLVVEGHAIETDSLLEAVDLCFKSFYVFDTNYPKECQPTWEFLQHCIYEINGQESSAVKFLRTAIAHT
ncbi:uncharacterized protein LOC114453764 [Parambassis ranga]|uniref:Uncharacterized protein LOC114429759 isoform X1 n=1 Tax=Parambassis ranga TaxID=210632 RepID=A0A6P7JIQ6_9TELE|nr:uncharacterized protein LOC114429759 isoform X1 [Parambassis ranga]XP_028254192.1 uncharacterized protein LOC114429759 isoform X1 [Parambassis ranga]XP_028254193.1 uncharacterized protein LOC114429759 isoform X1 [Parambassis ranga]XP_028254194.1 uncharacterized protein LOC114429759 isoform X1 [Parambassis ranga]XP_028254195.1 uncharacterized protein LOC114429759 isoform X1 [Parambassis ranga]XP_028254196.1 uncharacterized protein LOC114429759 isoform X1 [Parambassis ranga]XP_028254197.1 un